MEAVTVIVLLALGAAVLLPLVREYREFRRSWGLGRAGALATTGLVLPAFAAGFALALPLAARPGVQWAATVAATLVVYSLAVRAVESAVEPARDPG
ncbi:MAG TPA: hypothetical protein VHF23_02660 [Gaiellaceae bacterium]|nr:hypothetical protein [Gaiellaceae bacterium]